LHRPVLLDEVLNYLRPKPGQVILDATLGGGGHTKAILGRMEGKGLFLGIDQDEEAIRRVETQIGPSTNVILTKLNFSELDQFLSKYEVKKLDAVLFDLGVSSFQLDSPKRGFGFMKEGPLDMRMDLESHKAAKDFVNDLSQQELQDLFFKYGEERKAKEIARKIVASRRQKPFSTTTQLRELVRSCYPRRPFRIDPATRVFQALRIAVNNELKNLEQGLDKAIGYLACGGRIAVISFHSLEDRIVKHRFRREAGEGHFEILTKKVVRPTEEEMAANPRSRSAKLRVGERT